MTPPILRSLIHPNRPRAPRPPIDIVAAHEKLVQAVQFYADADSYFAIHISADLSCGDLMSDFSVHGNDDYLEGDERPGKRAREALMAWIEATGGDYG